MIFEIDEDSKKIMATIQRNDTAEKYECSLLSCDNPVCACQTVYLNLSPLRDDSEKGDLLSSHSVDIATFFALLNCSTKRGFFV